MTIGSKFGRGELSRIANRSWRNVPHLEEGTILDQQTELQPWDPLDIANRSDLEILTAAEKREIKNILKSYVGTYDPMSELIQNAMDAVEKRQAADPTFTPKLDIVIDLAENSFQVIDNGTGFDREQFRAFMAPNISFKKEATKPDALRMRPWVSPTKVSSANPRNITRIAARAFW